MKAQHKHRLPTSRLIHSRPRQPQHQASAVEVACWLEYPAEFMQAVLGFLR
ncbi:hypothetical protein NKH19_23510 [Mesorhizobium sp. M1338]|uniref:hypothetical protein n=1 Tax=unclassified Mesorhizobium TaxID=325217 RepID=UPI00333A7AC2